MLRTEIENIYTYIYTGWSIKSISILGKLPSKPFFKLLATTLVYGILVNPLKPQDWRTPQFSYIVMTKRWNVILFGIDDHVG